jgi:hypothetical protein
MTPHEPQNRLDELLNPSFLQRVYEEVFPEDESATALLEKFHVSRDLYQRVWPKNLPEELQTTTYCKELNVFIAAPLALCAASERTLVRLAVQIHGGGAVSAGATEPPSLG